jgi:hypothetical protein
MVLSLDTAQKLKQVEDAASELVVNPRYRKLFQEFVAWMGKSRKSVVYGSQ